MRRRRHLAFEGVELVGERHEGAVVVRCGAEDYLDACGARFAEKFPPAAFLRLSESIDLHAVDAASIRVPTTVVAVAEDRLVPVGDGLSSLPTVAG